MSREARDIAGEGARAPQTEVRLLFFKPRSELGPLLEQFVGDDAGERIEKACVGGEFLLPFFVIDPEQLGNAFEEALRPLRGMDGATLRLSRREKFLAMGGNGL